MGKIVMGQVHHACKKTIVILYSIFNQKLLVIANTPRRVIAAIACTPHVANTICVRLSVKNRL